MLEGASLDWSLTYLIFQFSSTVRDGRLRSLAVIMMNFRWSWIFILYSLLVRLGSASPGTDNHIVNDIHPRVNNDKPFFSSEWLQIKPVSSSSRPNVAAIVAGVFGSLAFITALIIWLVVFRKRRSIQHVEEGVKERPEGRIPDLKSEFSPDEKGGLRFDRIRDAFARRGLRKSQQGILPLYQTSLPPGSTESINRPTTPAPAHIPRYPSMLERGRNRPRPPPPPLGMDIDRMPSMTDSIQSAEPGDRASRRKVQIPPRVLLVPSPGRPLPGFGRLGASRSPRSPSRRKSWLSKRLSRHPFIPLRDPDPSIHFAPGSPLHPDHYHPSRELLEARLDSRSPRTPMTPRTPRTPKTARREPIRRLPVPLYEEEIGATTKSARLVEALHEDGNRTPVPPMSSKHPPSSSTPYI